MGALAAAASIVATGCASAGSPKAEHAPPPAPAARAEFAPAQDSEHAHATSTGQVSPASEGEAVAPEASRADAPADSLPDEVDGGAIPRAALFSVLQGGVGRFLGQVDVEPHLVGGRFIGWRLLRLFPHENELQSNVLRPGDTVMRVNGQSIERPEQFKNVWDSMATSSELVLRVRRAGKDSTVRYRIVE